MIMVTKENNFKTSDLIMELYQFKSDLTFFYEMLNFKVVQMRNINGC